MTQSDILELAEKIATEAHRGQFRRDGLPYIEHPKTVASRLGDDPDAQIVAWLHDVIEDCDVTDTDLLEQGIPEEHVTAVRILTKTKGISYDDYLENVAASALATRVKIADMVSNLADSPTTRQLKKYGKGLERLTREL